METIMKSALVGYTGFVGSNILEGGRFDYLFNSKNIDEAYGLRPDVLVYAGVSSEMFLANCDSEKDLNQIRIATENIRRINPKKIVLISTAAVYRDFMGSTEDRCMPMKDLSAYGFNRYFLECWVQDNFEEHLIIRLPAVFGKNIRKNFIYDYLHYVPAMLNKYKYDELREGNEIIEKAYELQENGFYVCKKMEYEELGKLREAFKEVGFSALQFTDSRSKYQFYNLSHLWEHIDISLKMGIKN